MEQKPPISYSLISMENCTHEQYMSAEMAYFISNKRWPSAGAIITMRAAGLIIASCSTCNKDIRHLDLVNQYELAKFIT